MAAVAQGPSTSVSPASRDTPHGCVVAPHAGQRPPTWHPCQSPTNRRHSNRHGCGARHGQAGRNWKSRSDGARLGRDARKSWPSEPRQGRPQEAPDRHGVVVFQRPFRAPPSGRRPTDVEPLRRWPDPTASPSGPGSDPEGFESDPDSRNGVDRCDGPPASIGRRPEDPLIDDAVPDQPKRHRQNSARRG